VDFAWPPHLDALRAEALELADRAVAEFGVHDDAWINGYSREFSKELGRRGWIGMTWPVEWGGGGRPAIERFVVTEALLSKGAPIAASWFADRQMGPTLIAYGTDEQKRAFLPGIISGSTGWCIGMSEPNSGSDLASLTTRAVLDGDTYVVNGQKIWTSFGETAEYCYLICRTSTEGPPHAGISELIVDMKNTPGITIAPIKDMTTNRHFCEVFYDDVRVPAANLVGAEGGSWKQTMRQLEHERGGIDRLLSNYALYCAVAPLADHTDPLMRQEMASLESCYRIGRLLVLREVLGQAPKQFSAATKTFCTEHQQRVAEFVGRVLGADAMLWGREARAICYAPAYTIMGGTSNVLRNIIGERTLGLPREPSV
jgi:alkylation response protein AidB-like acyl-CoA dehydrogenase